MTVVATMNEETVRQVKNFSTRELATLIRYEGKEKSIYQNKKSPPGNFTIWCSKVAILHMKKARVKRRL